MNRRIIINVADTNQLDKRIICFFKNYEFQLVENQNNTIKFRQNSSLFDGWKTNPLKWGSEISVSLSGNTIKASFIVDTDAQMKTKEEKYVWQQFIEAFKIYLESGELNNSSLAALISENKNSRLIYLGWAISGALIGAVFAFVCNKLTNDNSTFSPFVIPIMSVIFLRWRIKLSDRKIINN